MIFKKHIVEERVFFRRSARGIKRRFSEIMKISVIFKQKNEKFSAFYEKRKKILHYCNVFLENTLTKNAYHDIMRYSQKAGTMHINTIFTDF